MSPGNDTQPVADGAAAPAAVPTAVPEGETPAILLAGGRPRDENKMTKLLSEALKQTPNPSVAYIGTPNGDSTAFYAMIKLVMMKAGIKKITFVRLAKEKPDLKKAKTSLESADAIFISGGEVEDGMNWLKKHGLVQFLKELYAGGKQFVGISAGSIMLGSSWVKWEDEKDDSTASLFDCLGISPLIFDTHAEDEDWKELKAALRLMGGGAVGYGIPSGGLISADSAGNLVNLTGEVLVFRNDNGSIVRAENGANVT